MATMIGTGMARVLNINAAGQQQPRHATTHFQQHQQPTKNCALQQRCMVGGGMHIVPQPSNSYGGLSSSGSYLWLHSMSACGQLGSQRHKAHEC